MKKLPDGDHALPNSEATLTIEKGLPVRITLARGDDAYEDALDEAEDVTDAWIEENRDAYGTADDDTLGDEQVILVRLFDVQPTHAFTSPDRGRQTVRLTEMEIEGGQDDHTYNGHYTCALDRGAHEEGEDALGWPPFLDNGVWRDSWTGRPIEGARVEPLESEAQA